MGKFFSSENWFWKGFGVISDLFMLTCCWLLCSIPLITIGSSSIALFDTVAHCVRGGEGDMFKRFFRTFKNELGRGILITIVWAVICFVLNAGYQILTQMAAESDAWGLVSIIYFLALVVPLGWLCWVVAVDSRFVYSFGQLHRVSFIFTFAHLPQTIAMVVLLVVAINLVTYFPFLIILVPGFLVHFQVPFAEKVLKKYMPKDEEPEEAPEAPEEAPEEA